MPYKPVNDALPSQATYSIADLINASGEIAGTGYLPVGNNENAMGATWSTDGTATRLPGFGTDWSPINVYGINSSGDVVGQADNGGSTADAVLWFAGATTPTILNDAGGMAWDFARAINDAGDSSGSRKSQAAWKRSIGTPQTFQPS